jgi:nucleotide-binding universal stress UspA family protein
VLHVTEPVPLFVPAELPVPLVGTPAVGVKIADSEALREARRKHAMTFVEKTVKALQEAGLKADSEIVEGHAKSKIIDYADHWGADLIVIGSHGLTGMQRFLLGSVSDAVARHAKCSVQIVKIAASGAS